MKTCFGAADILLPNKNVDLSKWAVIACDQYTSQSDYWEKVEEIVGSAPSTLNMVYPEVYLGKGQNRTEAIHRQMDEYMENGTLCESVKNGFVLLVRHTARGDRLGIVGIIDLEQYDFTPGSGSLVRATEGTIRERIPPRMKIREGACVELSHVMLLMDDSECRLIEPLAGCCEAFRCLYDVELMMDGGHLRGYAIEGEEAVRLCEQIAEIEKKCGGFLFAVGDGNHSLATAKACWEKKKRTLSEEEQEKYPARYALVEVVNLHSPSLVFEPIHRVLFGADAEDVEARFEEYVTRKGMASAEGSDIQFVCGGKKIARRVDRTAGRIPADVLQEFLDDYLEGQKAVSMDYVHGEDAVAELTESGENVGILLSRIDKKMLFPAIVAGGVLPRKTFSMGEASEKRYYMECRKMI